MGGVAAVTLGPDSRLPATAGKDGIRVSYMANGATSVVLSGLTSAVEDLGFGPDGKHLVAFDQGNLVRVWDLTPPEERPRPPGSMGDRTSGPVSCWFRERLGRAWRRRLYLSRGVTGPTLALHSFPG